MPLPRHFDSIPIFILRQVDEFAVAAPNLAIANQIFDLLQAGLRQTLKLLSILSMHNQINVSQSNRYIKLSCAICIHKMLKGNNWQKSTHKFPLSSPMHHDKNYLRKLETTTGPTDTVVHATLKKGNGILLPTIHT